MTGPVTGDHHSHSLTQPAPRLLDWGDQSVVQLQPPPASRQQQARLGGGERVEIKNAALAGCWLGQEQLDKSQLPQLTAVKESGYGQSKQAPLYVYLLCRTACLEPQPSLRLIVFTKTILIIAMYVLRRINAKSKRVYKLQKKKGRLA